MNVAMVSAAVLALGAGGMAWQGAAKAGKAQEAAEAARANELAAQNDALKVFTSALVSGGDAQEGGAPALAQLLNRAALASADMPEERQRHLLAAIASAYAGSTGAPVVSCEVNTTWQEFFDGAAKAAGRTALANFTTLEPLGLGAKQPVGLTFSGMSLADAVQFLNENSPSLAQDGKIAVREREGVLEFASEAFFDSRETTTRTFDLDAVVQSLLDKEATEPSPSDDKRHTRISAEESVCEEVSRLICEMVNPNMWKENGGEAASIRRFGSKLFITAPQRHFDKVEWVLKEVGAFEKGAAAASPFDASTLTISTDKETGNLRILTADGNVMTCSQLVLSNSEPITALLSGGEAPRRMPVPVLGELPIISNFFRTNLQVPEAAAPDAAPAAEPDPIAPAGGR